MACDEGVEGDSKGESTRSCESEIGNDGVVGVWVVVG